MYRLKIDQFENMSNHETLDKAKKRVCSYFPRAAFMEVMSDSFYTVVYREFNKDTAKMERIGDIIKK